MYITPYSSAFHSRPSSTRLTFGENKPKFASTSVWDVSEENFPHAILAGGTIATKRRGEVREQAEDVVTGILERRQLKTDHLDPEDEEPFGPGGVDSSQIRPEMQAQLMQILGKVLQKNTITTGLSGAFGGTPFKIQGPEIASAPQASYALEDIRKHFKIPVKVGRGVYVTHGTDTMVNSAAMAGYLFFNTGLVTVWTGAWNSANEEGYDGEENAIRAYLLASDPNTPPGSYIVIGDYIYNAVNCEKIANAPPEGKTSYFDAIEGEPAGYFTKSAEDTYDIFFNTPFLRLQEQLSKTDEQATNNPFVDPFDFNWSRFDKPAYVEHAVIDKHTPVQVWTDMRDRLKAEQQGDRNRLCGAIIEGDLSTRKDWKQIQREIEDLKKEGIFVYHNLQHLSGLQAHIKLSVLLKLASMEALKATPENIDNLMEKNIAGEIITEESALASRIKVPPNFHKKYELILAHPGLTAQVLIDAAERNVDLQRVRRLLILGLGDGHVTFQHTDSLNTPRLRDDIIVDTLAEMMLRYKRASRQLHHPIVVAAAPRHAIPSTAYAPGARLDELGLKFIDTTFADFLKQFESRIQKIGRIARSIVNRPSRQGPQAA